VFRRDPAFGGTLGPAFGPWTQFRDELASIMRQTAENLEATGHALMLAADGYNGADQQAKDVLRKHESEIAAADARAARLSARHLRLDL